MMFLVRVTPGLFIFRQKVNKLLLVIIIAQFARLWNLDGIDHLSTLATEDCPSRCHCPQSPNHYTNVCTHSTGEDNFAKIELTERMFGEYVAA